MKQFSPEQLGMEQYPNMFSVYNPPRDHHIRSFDLVFAILPRTSIGFWSTPIHKPPLVEVFEGTWWNMYTKWTLAFDGDSNDFLQMFP